MTGFGIAMGFVFPVYANFFVTWKPGMFVYFLTGCILAGIIVGVVSFWFVKRILLKALKQVSKVGNGICNKDISEHIFVHINSNDSVGDIATGLNTAVAGLRDFLNKINHITGLIENIIRETEKSGANGSYMQNIENSIQIVTHTSEQITLLSEQIIKEVSDGKKVLEKNVYHLEVTVKDFRDLTKLVTSLLEGADKVQKMNDLIHKVASKTDLLSVNASIEASRAGDQGKGFAVVATEVQKLAQQSTESANKISDIVSGILSDMKSALTFMNTIGELVNQNHTDCRDLSRQFEEIEKITYSNQSMNQELEKVVNDLNYSFRLIHEAFGNLACRIVEIKDEVSAYKQ
jgi:methyl-accepting chemotaxis protein